MRGYTLLELLLSTAIVLAIGAAVAGLLGPARHASLVQPEIADLQQRLRGAASMLYRDLAKAGAGPYHGAAAARTGSLRRFFAPILPYRAGRPDHDPVNGVFYRDDAVTILYVPATAAQSTISDRLAAPFEVRVAAEPGCPQDDGHCGFTEGMSIVIFDGSTAWDSFAVIGVTGPSLGIRHRGFEFSRPYDPGATVVEAAWHTYYHDAAQRQLRRSDGLNTDVPIADNVAAVRFTYFGTPEPPVFPRPAPSEENCVVDAGGAPKLPVLPAMGQRLVELDPAILSDGGGGAVRWCGANGHLFDPDLLRIRRVRVGIRMTAGPAARGAVPDAEVLFDVTPRNLEDVR